MNEKILTQELLDSYLESKLFLDSLVEKVWNYIYDNNYKLLNYDRQSWLYDWEMGHEYLYIEYGGGSQDPNVTSHFEPIPLEVLLNDTWKEFIDEYFCKLIEEEKAEKEAVKAAEKKRRQKLFEELKKEFEDNQE